MKNVSVSLLTTLSFASLLMAGCGGSKSSSPAQDPTVTTSGTNEGLLLGTWKLVRETSAPNQIQTESAPRLLKFQIASDQTRGVSYCRLGYASGSNTWKYTINGRQESQLMSPMGRISFEYLIPHDSHRQGELPFETKRFEAQVTKLDDDTLELDNRIRYVRIGDSVGKFDDLCSMKDSPNRP